MPKLKKKYNKRRPIQIAERLTAVSIRRSEKTMLIDPSSVKKPEWMTVPDPIFSRLYKKYLLGQIPGFLTRMPITMIREGFYLVSNNLEYCCDSPPEQLIKDQVYRIQLGERPALHVYPNSNKNDAEKFLCPDDVLLCIAYKRLNIASIPVVVFAPGRLLLPFSSFESKARTFGGRTEVCIHRIVSVNAPTELSSICGQNLANNSDQILHKLTNHVEILTSKIRSFHISRQGQLHYHHMLFSALIRMQETLQAIKILIEKNLWYQALSLLRVLYEIHLNFYFDWLQPETNYKFLAAAAVFSGGGISRQRFIMKSELILEGLTQTMAEEKANLAWTAVTLASNVSEKAKLSKVGILFHREIYDFLSQISHQNFEVASLHANRFDDSHFLTIEDNVKTTYLRFMDLIVSEFCLCIAEDIGGN